MSDLAPLLDRARACLRGGDPRQAEANCRGALREEPRSADAWRLLGAALQAQGRLDEAAAAFREALRLRPADADAHCELGAVLASLGRRGEALDAYREAVRLRPDHAEALVSLGVALGEQGRAGEAVDLLRRAVAARPTLARAHLNLGVALAQQGQPAEALAALDAALRLQPDYAEAAFNRGNVLGDLGRRDEALAAYERALDLRPDHAGALNNLGLALAEAGRPAEAVPVLRQAARLQPASPAAWNNLARALTDLARFAEAEAAVAEALRLEPGGAEGHHHLGNLYKEQGRLEEALACYRQALRLDPHSAATQYNRALALLQAGDYARGWPAYEWRWKRKKAKPRTFREPAWDGGPLAGRTILLWCEQGLGDALQFVRYAPRVKARGAAVVLECPGYLLPLLSTCPGVDRLVAEGAAPPPFDVQVPLMSLPGLLGTTLATVPAAVPYLSADPARVERWGQQLRATGAFTVGVVWQGNPYHQWDRHRSAPLAAFAPLAAVEGVRLVSLQRVHGLEQLGRLGGRFAVAELAGEFDGPGAAFLDTAAVMAGLDLVVSVDTAAAHLAGALGVPAWVALAAVADWRWLVGREDTPWYPTLRLFRQAAPGDWPGVFGRMAAELARLVRGRGRRGAVRVDVAAGELVDRIAILELKAERLADAGKRQAVRAELAALRAARDRSLPASAELDGLAAGLRRVNEVLWDVEDRLRECEAAGEFGGRFVGLARSVYRTNDERAALKRRVNELLGAAFDEPKQYAAYGRGPEPAPSDR